MTYMVEQQQTNAVVCRIKQDLVSKIRMISRLQ
jgi:hypothetical protein